MSEYFKHETAIIDNGARIGNGSRVWHWTHICSEAKLEIAVLLDKTYL